MKERQDSKGRKLKDGEGQRKNGLYYYRYTDSSGKRLTIYDHTLSQLREKEKEIQLEKENSKNKDNELIKIQQINQELQTKNENMVMTDTTNNENYINRNNY